MRRFCVGSVDGLKCFVAHIECAGAAVEVFKESSLIVAGFHAHIDDAPIARAAEHLHLVTRLNGAVWPEKIGAVIAVFAYSIDMANLSRRSIHHPKSWCREGAGRHQCCRQSKRHKVPRHGVLLSIARPSARNLRNTITVLAKRKPPRGYAAAWVRPVL